MYLNLVSILTTTLFSVGALGLVLNRKKYFNYYNVY